MDKEEAPRAIAAAARLERRLGAFGARPHWGKLTTLGPRELEERFGEGLLRFRALRDELDPRRKFCNAWCERHVLGETG